MRYYARVSRLGGLWIQMERRGELLSEEASRSAGWAGRSFATASPLAQRDHFDAKPTRTAGPSVGPRTGSGAAAFVTGR
jgi:hypothetical protein